MHPTAPLGRKLHPVCVGTACVYTPTLRSSSLIRRPSHAGYRQGAGLHQLVQKPRGDASQQEDQAASWAAALHHGGSQAEAGTR